MITVPWDNGLEPIILHFFEVKKHFLNIVSFCLYLFVCFLVF